MESTPSLLKLFDIPFLNKVADTPVEVLRIVCVIRPFVSHLRVLLYTLSCLQEVLRAIRLWSTSALYTLIYLAVSRQTTMRQAVDLAMMHVERVSPCYKLI